MKWTFLLTTMSVLFLSNSAIADTFRYSPTPRIQRLKAAFDRVDQRCGEKARAYYEKNLRGKWTPCIQRWIEASVLYKSQRAKEERTLRRYYNSQRAFRTVTSALAKRRRPITDLEIKVPTQQTIKKKEKKRARRVVRKRAIKPAKKRLTLEERMRRLDELMKKLRKKGLKDVKKRRLNGVIGGG